MLALLCRYDPEVKHKPRRLRMGLFSWVKPTIFYPEDEIVTVAGLDVAVFLRMLSFGEGALAWLLQFAAGCTAQCACLCAAAAPDMR